MKEGWGIKISRTGITSHYYRNGTALCSNRNFFLDTEQLREQPKELKTICPKCRAKWRP